MQTGDIVSIRRRTGLWAAVEQVPSPNPPANERWRCQRFNGNDTNYTGFVAGAGDLAVMGSPVFTPGQTLKHRGQTATVIADHGATIRCHIESRRELRGGGYVDTSGPTEISRADLAAENATHLLKLLEQSN